MATRPPMLVVLGQMCRSPLTELVFHPVPLTQGRPKAAERIDLSCQAAVPRSRPTNSASTKIASPPPTRVARSGLGISEPPAT